MYYEKSYTTNKPSVYIRDGCYERIMAYSRECEYEILGLLIGHIEEDAQSASSKAGNYPVFRATNHKLIIDATELIDQEVTGGSADLDISSVHKWMRENVKKSGRVVGWWHSHARMSPFISLTDQNTSKELAKARGFTIAIVTNHDGNYICEIFLNSVIGCLSMSASLIKLLSKKREIDIKEEIKQKVKMKQYKLIPAVDLEDWREWSWYKDYLKSKLTPPSHPATDPKKGKTLEETESEQAKSEDQKVNICERAGELENLEVGDIVEITKLESDEKDEVCWDWEHDSEFLSEHNKGEGKIKDFPPDFKNLAHVQCTVKNCGFAQFIPVKYLQKIEKEKNWKEFDYLG